MLRKALWIRKVSSGEEVGKRKVTCLQGLAGRRASQAWSVHTSEAPSVRTLSCWCVKT